MVFYIRWLLVLYIFFSLGEIKYMGEIFVYCRFMFYGGMFGLFKYLEYDYCFLIYDWICVYILFYRRFSYW